ncbi:MAG TPA: hypothetical protein VF470_08510, partial [Sphingomicrobium sp.]
RQGYRHHSRHSRFVGFNRSRRRPGPAHYERASRTSGPRLLCGYRLDHFHDATGRNVKNEWEDAVDALKWFIFSKGAQNEFPDGVFPDEAAIVGACDTLHTSPWVIVAALNGLDEQAVKFNSMRLWLDWAAIVNTAQAGANGQGPAAIKVEVETFG